MGQADVLEVLENNKGWMTNKQIAKILSITPSNVNRALSILIRTGEAVCKTKREKFNGRIPLKYMAMSCVRPGLKKPTEDQ